MLFRSAQIPSVTSRCLALEIVRFGESSPLTALKIQAYIQHLSFSSPADVGLYIPSVTSQRFTLEIVRFGESSPLTALKCVERGNPVIQNTIFPHKNKKIRRYPGHKHIMGQIPTHGPVTGFINGDEIQFKNISNKRNRFHSLNNNIKINQFLNEK